MFIGSMETSSLFDPLVEGQCCTQKQCSIAKVAAGGEQSLRRRPASPRRMSRPGWPHN